MRIRSDCQSRTNWYEYTVLTTGGVISIAKPQDKFFTLVLSTCFLLADFHAVWFY